MNLSICSNIADQHQNWINCYIASTLLQPKFVWTFLILRMWLNNCPTVPFQFRSLKTHSIGELLISACLSVPDLIEINLIKRLRMCGCTFIQIYDRILCIIQSPCVIITDISFIQFFQQPDEDPHISHAVLHFTVTPLTLLYHNLADNNPTLIPSNSQIFPVSSSCHNTKHRKVLACIRLKC